MTDINVTLHLNDKESEAGPCVKTYKVPFEQGMTALHALLSVYEQEPFGFRHSCDGMLCTLCMMRINGKQQLACKLVMMEPFDLEVEPPKRWPQLRDLACDMSGVDAD